MLALEDTETAIKRAEQHLHRNDESGAGTKDKVAFKADVVNAEGQDAKKLAALEAQVQALQA